ncbi:MAG: helix-turn-helix domain-containing protein [Cenarchaeum sp. SB0663_bin_5]|nr:helix-turn-helix domain-containing protein [Cenarchaeum sp. SB0663_bin_5]MYH04117.1 helix-turn-helix domain-containing protein [Cenarchaeum sp. SB0675_bin_21]MYL10593.1 helix-turn-helix domain-containing protein [Cenarchaeum sp. SB0669_bin_11]
MITAIPSCKEIPKELLILTTVLKRKRCGSISGIARDVGRPYATVYGWLLRVYERGLDGRVDKPSPNRKRILDEDAYRLILEWVSGSPPGL